MYYTYKIINTVKYINIKLEIGKYIKYYQNNNNIIK
jgi:hypothetical protein